MRRLRTAAGLATLVTILPLVLTGCGSKTSDAEAGALAAAQRYVDAIAARDARTADAMTDPSARRQEPIDHSDSSLPDNVLKSRESVDITAALPSAVDPIQDPWVTFLGPSDDSDYDGTAYVVGVSYTLRGLTGGSTITVRLDKGADPDKIASWTVTDPLIVEGDVFASKSIHAVRFGPVKVQVALAGSGHRGVWGYPAGYLVKPASPRPDVDPLWVAVGAPSAPPWTDDLPMLHPRGEDQ